MRKKVLSLVLAVVIVAAMLPTTARAEDYTEVIPCKYGIALEFSEGLAAVQGENGKWGHVDKTGEMVIPCMYSRTSSFSESLAAVQDEYDKWGFIDKTGKVVIPCVYDAAYSFSEGLAAVRSEYSKWGFIDKTGEEVASCKYFDVIWDFSEGLAAVQDENYDWGFIDKTGNEVIPCKYDNVKDFSEDLAAVRDENYKWGYIDKTGEVVIPCEYDDAYSFSEGLAAVKDEYDKFGFIDKTGKVVIPCMYEWVERFSEGLVAVEDENNRFGYIDKTGKVVISCEYYDAEDFSEGFAAVTGEGGWGFIDKTGEVVIPCKYRDAGDFSEGLAAVAVWDETEKWGFVSFEKLMLTIDHSGLVHLSCNCGTADSHQVAYGDPAAITLVPDEGYALPSSVSVTMNGQAFSDFQYDASTGTITIAAGKITGNLAITATGSTVAPNPNPGGPGGSSSSSDDDDDDDTTTSITTNSNGSTTTKVTDHSTGTVTETTRDKDGTKTVKETKKDGTVTTTKTQKDGTVSKIAEKDGQQTVSVTYKKADEPTVKLPVYVPVNATVTVSGQGEGKRVEIPVTGLTAGTVAVLVENGQEKVIPTALTTNSGLSVALPDGATVKVKDNTKSFNDVAGDYWGRDAVTFVTSRELFNGTGSGSFSPNATMTRQMLMTVLARLDGADTKGAAYEKGMAWAVSAGISDGKSPEADISREQLAVMLYRYAGKLGMETTASGDLSKFSDSSQTSAWAEEAMGWAVGAGLIGGKGGGVVDPTGTATRAEVATILQRMTGLMAK